MGSCSSGGTKARHDEAWAAFLSGPSRSRGVEWGGDDGYEPVLDGKPAQQLDLKNTNLALFATEAEYRIKEQAAGKEPAWQVLAKKWKAGLHIWRVEQFKIKVWPEEDHGDFFTGDSYILLHSWEVKDKLCHAIHFWIGRYSAPDEAGTAAYKTTELSDFVRAAGQGVARHHREVQGDESPRFLGLFMDPKLFSKPRSIHLMAGGVASGFRHVKQEKYQPRLFHVKSNGKNGKERFVRCSQVPCKKASLKSSDVMLLDAGTKIVQWNGSGSDPWERAESCRQADILQAARAAHHYVIDEGSNTLGTPGELVWNEVLK